MATMRDILIENGFKYSKDCSSCGGAVEDWVKVVNGKTALFKLKKTYTAGTLMFKGTVTRVNHGNLENILQKHGLNETIQQEG